MAGIYVHIPFCKQKCLYCDFASGAADAATIKRYHNALLNEIKQTQFQNINPKPDTIFFGGGTPSLYPTALLEEILLVLKNHIDKKNAEITLETNPGTLTNKNLKAYKDMGINRLSIGLQSADDEELKILGRIHTYEEFKHSYCMARESGFDNINIDIISAIPMQTFESYSNTLKRVAKLNPEHISAYSLIVEEETPFYQMYGEGKQFEYQLPDEDLDRKMYYYTNDYLKEMGYERYEISNYSKPEYECRHNLKYWSMEEYYGFGVSAASKLNSIRYKNTSNLEEYCTILESGNIEDIRSEMHLQTRTDEIEEFMFLGLRKMAGVSDIEFKKRFGISYWEEYGIEIKKLIKNKLLKSDEDKIILTKKGIDLSNMVFLEFVKNK